MNDEKIESEASKLKAELFRYLNFWPYFVFSALIFLGCSYTYIRYTPDVFETNAKIKILDQERDLALPTAMTIFNRSMINLENEIELLKSTSLIGQVTQKLNLQLKHYNLSFNKIHEINPDNWIDGSDHTLIIDKDFLTQTQEINQYDIYINEDGLRISDNFNESEYFNDEYNSSGMDLPFYLSLNNLDEISNLFDKSYRLEIYPFKNTVSYYKESLIIKSVGSESDILSLTLNGNSISKNSNILNTLIELFDQDGINDRRLNSKRTIDFVNNRINDITKDLELVESTKQKFKIDNELIEVEENAKMSINQKIGLEEQLLSVSTQIKILELLYETLSDEEAELLPVNIGLEDESLNNLIIQFNQLIIEKNKVSFGAGENNPVLNAYSNNIKVIKENIIKSIKAFESQLTLNENLLIAKNDQYLDKVLALPEDEKILRSIEREQSVKEAIFVLLLQKREEASINFAVTSPSIKVIDPANTSIYPISPNPKFIYLFSFVIGVALPFTILFIWFYLDTKIHTKEQLSRRLNDIPIIGEIPFIKDKSLLKLLKKSNVSRDILSESIRMTIANLNFILFKDTNKNNCKTILVTSSVKGEGKTIVSVNLSARISSPEDKVLLIGADLRNPQIHKFLNLDKNKVSGLSDFIYKNDDDYKKYIVKHENLDMILSGSIPPNPNELLSSAKFANLINELKKVYDYIIIDSAPCVLVSDTFAISKHIDATVYVVRSTFTDIQLTDFINECQNENKLPNMNIVLNSVGSKQSYAYGYGYGYGYKDGYNYGYGYGYSEDK